MITSRLLDSNILMVVKMVLAADRNRESNRSKGQNNFGEQSLRTTVKVKKNISPRRDPNEKKKRPPSRPKWTPADRQRSLRIFSEQLSTYYYSALLYSHIYHTEVIQIYL